MINKNRIRWKLLQMLLLASVVTLVTAAVIDIILQARSASLSTQNETTTRWLTGQVIKTQDPKLSPIIMKISAELGRLSSNFEAPNGNMAKAPMFDSSKSSRTLEGTFPLPKIENEPQVSIAFDQFTYYPFDPKTFFDKEGAKPEQKDYERDITCYSTFMAPFFDVVQQKQIRREKYDVDTALREYSDAIFKSFSVDNNLTDQSPKLTIGNIFASSSNGTLAIFPWNSTDLTKDPKFNLKKRAWYLSAYGISEDQSRTEEFLLPGYGGTFGLSPFYRDAVSHDYIRTLWHKFTVKDKDNEKEITYVLCVDLILSSSSTPFLSGNLLPTWITQRGGITEALMIGAVSSIVVLLLGALLVLILSTLSPQILSYFLVRRRPKEWVAEERFTPVIQALAPQRSITFIDVDKHEHGGERKVNFAAWFQLAIAKLEFGGESYSKVAKQIEKREEVTLNTVDRDPSIRGYEEWQVFRTRWRSEGRCRLCGQDVKYKDTDEQIAEPTIRHRRTQIPAIDMRLATNSSVQDTKSLEEAIIWQATDTEPKAVGIGYPLTSAPPPRIPAIIQDLSLFKDSLKTFRMLSQSRIEVADCVRLSNELFPNRNVRAVCHIDYLRKIASEGEPSLDALRQGKNIERILVANKPEDMVNFVNSHRTTVERLLSARNQELFRLYLDDTGVNFNTFGNQRFDLDFAIVYGEGEPPLVLASNLNELNTSGSVKGYLSWRKVDVFFFQTLYESFVSRRETLRLDDLPLLGSDMHSIES